MLGSTNFNVSHKPPNCNALAFIRYRMRETAQELYRFSVVRVIRRIQFIQIARLPIESKIEAITVSLVGHQRAMPHTVGVDMGFFVPLFCGLIINPSLVGSRKVKTIEGVTIDLIS